MDEDTADTQADSNSTPHAPGQTFNPGAASTEPSPTQLNRESIEAAPTMPPQSPEISPSAAQPQPKHTVEAHEPANHPYKRTSAGRAILRELLYLIVLLAVLSVAGLAAIYFLKI